MNASVWEMVLRATRHGWNVGSVSATTVVLQRPWLRKRRVGVLMVMFDPRWPAYIRTICYSSSEHYCIDRFSDKGL